MVAIECIGPCCRHSLFRLRGRKWAENGQICLYCVSTRWYQYCFDCTTRTLGDLRGGSEERGWRHANGILFLHVIKHLVMSTTKILSPSYSFGQKILSESIKVILLKVRVFGRVSYPQFFRDRSIGSKISEIPFLIEIYYLLSFDRRLPDLFFYENSLNSMIYSLPPPPMGRLTSKTLKF